jgi:uncharacterized membrane protein
MNAFLRTVFKEIAGLFVDDSNLAAFATVLIVVIAGAVKLLNVPPLGVALLAGVIAILIESLVRAAGPPRRKR